MMYLYTEYQTRTAGDLGAAPTENIVMEGGIQHVEPQTAGFIFSFLANLTITSQAAVPEGVRFTAEPCAPRETCPRAIDQINTKPPGSTVVVGFGPGPNTLRTPSAELVSFVIIPQGNNVAALAGPEMDFAVLDVSQAVIEAPAEEKKKKPLLVGAVAGAGVGFLVAGGLGAAVGAGVGAVAANLIVP